jgi:archaemetzincin
MIDHAAALRAETLPPPFDRLKAAATPLGPGAPGSWLSVHPERGQSYAQFARTGGSFAGAIVLARLGNTTAVQRRVLAQAATGLAAFFGRPVRFGPDLDLARVPPADQRPSRGFGLQVRTGFVLDSLLVPARPADAVVAVALATVDLYPEESWNFVFGQARPDARVGVWSLARFGDDEPVLLRRTLRTACHEIAHLAGLPHCIAWSCLMNGSNSLPEADARPLELCPSCMAKLCRALDLEPVARAGELAKALDGMGLAAEAQAERKLQSLLAAKPN